MKLLAVVDHPDHVCCRYRIRPLEALVARHGRRVDYISSLPWYGASFPSADVAVVQRQMLRDWQWRRLRRRCPFIVFDYDDAVWMRDSYSPKGLNSPRRQRKFRRAIQSVDQVVAGNSFLADFAIQWTSRDRIHVIPTCVDTSRYSLAAHSEDGKTLRIVWIGSSSTLQGLERMSDVFRRLGRSFPETTLVLICDRCWNLPDLRVEFHPWCEAHEAAWLATADVGISWLPDDDWSRGKCGLKILQYMAAGLPTLANPVGIQCELVQHGQTGFLVRTADDWLQAIDTLTKSATLRRTMGLNGRRVVEERYSLVTMRSGWERVLSAARLSQAA